MLHAAQYPRRAYSDRSRTDPLRARPCRGGGARVVRVVSTDAGGPYHRGPIPGAAMGTTLAAALDDARRRGFVGRAGELAAFERALQGVDVTRVLFVHGPGGIGKSTLLDEMRRRARAAGRETVVLDGRDIGGSLPAVADPVAAATADGREPGPVLLVDGYELLTPLDRWFRTRLLPSLPASSVTVLAGREPPAPDWAADPGWRLLLDAHPLPRLDAAESEALLRGLGVAGPDRERLAALGRGHPLALVLLAEAGSDGPAPAALGDRPGLVADLCRVLVDDVPDEHHRIGLATCAHSFRTTQDLLAATVGDRASQVWRWLAMRPYTATTSQGLRLHDLVRDVFDAEFAQRSPDAYAELHRTIRMHTVTRLVAPDSVTRYRDATELILLHRRSPAEAELSVLRDGGAPAVSAATPGDHERMCAVAAASEGPHAEPACRHWLTTQPAGAHVARSDSGVEAVALHVLVDATTDTGPDPVVPAVLEAVSRRRALRPGERIGVCRFVGDLAGSQRSPVAVLTASVSASVEWLSRPVGWSVVTPVDEAYWRPFFDYLGFSVLARVPVPGGGEVTAFAWDRARLSLEAFLDMTGRRELTGETGPPPPELLRPAPMGRDAFDAAVRAALRDLSRPDRLAGCPLATTALGPDVRQVIVQTLDGLAAEPRGDVLLRVLDRTYLHGAPSQEAAAEVLGLPFSTYRRHLARATERLADLLWAREVNGGPGTDGHEPDRIRAGE